MSTLSGAPSEIKNSFLQQPSSSQQTIPINTIRHRLAEDPSSPRAMHLASRPDLPDYFHPATTQPMDERVLGQNLRLVETEDGVAWSLDATPEERELERERFLIEPGILDDDSDMYLPALLSIEPELSGPFFVRDRGLNFLGNGSDTAPLRTNFDSDEELGDEDASTESGDFGGGLAESRFVNSFEWAETNIASDSETRTLPQADWDPFYVPTSPEDGLLAETFVAPPTPFLSPSDLSDPQNLPSLTLPPSSFLSMFPDLPPITPIPSTDESILSTSTQQTPASLSPTGSYTDLLSEMDIEFETNPYHVAEMGRLVERILYLAGLSEVEILAKLEAGEIFEGSPAGSGYWRGEGSAEPSDW